MAEGTGIPGRPKGATNSEMNLDWNTLRKTLKHYPEFVISENDDVIKYPIGDTEHICITKIEEKRYQLSYVFNNLEINCQVLKNDTDLDNFINKLLYDDYDFVIEGFIKQFKI
jgi:hypothetical protein